MKNIRSNESCIPGNSRSSSFAKTTRTVTSSYPPIAAHSVLRSIFLLLVTTITILSVFYSTYDSSNIDATKAFGAVVAFTGSSVSNNRIQRLQHRIRSTFSPATSTVLSIPGGTNRGRPTSFDESIVLKAASNDDDDDLTDGYTLFDRFCTTCPSDVTAIKKFDANLISNADENDIVWVGVYRSTNNKPSVLVQDDFLQAMKSATAPPISSFIIDTSDDVNSSLIETSSSPNTQTPVAVAKLYKKYITSNDNDSGITDSSKSTNNEDAYYWVLDSMRCTLKKETTNTYCDGGSEHTEAIATAIDALLLHYLQSSNRFDGMIYTKATLVSAPILQQRGFQEITTLSADMFTHVSNLDDCLLQYAARIATTNDDDGDGKQLQVAKSPGSLQRAIDIVSCLGLIDRDSDLEESKQLQQAIDDENKSDDNDPWSGVTQFVY